jgi:proteasome lid subunit RPN8/RPN11
LPVFVPYQILAEIETAARAATPMEVGGVLIGHLHRDASGELFSEVTAQIPALDAVGSEAQLNFPPKAWATVRAAVNLRARREIWVGWWHSHPVRAWEKCRECGPERLEQCTLATAFFSAQDRMVHRTVFSRAHMVGLVANDLAAGVRMAMFGWRDGSIEQRGFHVTGGEERALIRVTGGEAHAR